METRRKSIPESHTDKVPGSGETPDVSHTPRQPLWETIVEIDAQIPQEEWVKVPDDASINYKHYLYGIPKKI